MTMETEELDEIADSIEKVAQGLQALKKSRLKPSTIYLLISKSTTPRISPTNVKRVMEAAAGLADTYVKPVRKKL